MAEESNKVSVVIPTYNRSVLLKKAIQSLQMQTHTNLEIIIVDDFSSDDTAEMVEGMEDERIVYLKHEVNMGGAKARNTGIEIATGDYVGFLDSDDQWLPEKLEKQLAVFRGNPEAGVVYTGVRVINGVHIIKEIIPEFRGNLLGELLQSNCIDTTSSVLAKRDVLERVGGFNPLLPSCQDWDLYLRLAQVSQFDYVREVMVLFNQHPGARISTNFKAVVGGHLQIYQEYGELAKMQGADAFQAFSLKIAKTIFRMAMISQDRNTVILARKILVKGLAKTNSAAKNVFFYFSTYINLQFLLLLYTQFERFNSGYSVPSQKEAAKTSGG